MKHPIPQRRPFLGVIFVAVAAASLHATATAAPTQRLLYVVCPGIRDYLEFGGAGIVVFDMDQNYAFVRRIETPASVKEKPLNVKGVCACAATGRLYFTTLTTVYCLDLLTDKVIWEVEPIGGADRLSITPDGKILYVPSLEKDTWNVLEAETGKPLAVLEPKNGAHNTVVSRNGSRMYLGGLKAPWLFIADTKTHEIVSKVGPFSGSIRPFTTSGSGARAYVCVNDLLGYEVGNLETGEVLAKVEVTGFAKGPVKRHGCPSHGIGLTPNEREVWVVDAHNEHVHVFDNTSTPPKQVASVKLREQPGWVTISLDGKHALLSTGEVVEVDTKSIVAALQDEKGRPVHSEKMVEIHFSQGKPVENGDQFGVGRVVVNR